MTERPIFVVGYERSGTTLLQALLGAHPRIAAPPELHYLLRIVELADHYGDLTSDANLERALHDTINPPLALLDGCGFDETALLAKARIAERSYRSLLHVVMDDYARRLGKQRWSEKTPGQSVRAVLALCPDAQVVHIVRDARDVVASAMETPWSSLSARMHATYWRAFVLDNLAAGAQAGPGSYHLVRYEDLTLQPEVALRSVTTFLGEDFAPQMLTDLDARRASVADVATWQHTALQAVDATRQGSWRTRLTWRQQAQVAAVSHRQLVALGYPAPSVGAMTIGYLLNAGERRAPKAADTTRASAEDRYDAVQAQLRSVAERVRPSR